MMFHGALKTKMHEQLQNSRCKRGRSHWTFQQSRAAGVPLMCFIKLMRSSFLMEHVRSYCHRGMASARLQLYGGRGPSSVIQGSVICRRPNEVRCTWSTMGGGWQQQLRRWDQPKQRCQDSPPPLQGARCYMLICLLDGALKPVSATRIPGRGAAV